MEPLDGISNEANLVGTALDKAVPHPKQNKAEEPSREVRRAGY